MCHLWTGTNGEAERETRRWRSYYNTGMRAEKYQEEEEEEVRSAAPRLNALKKPATPNIWADAVLSGDEFFICAWKTEVI